jgi:thiamine-monophosphate kinase
MEGAITTVADLGEFGLIAAIHKLLPPSDHAIVGVGDDAAVLPAPDGRVVATTDLLVEGRHFRRDWSAARDIGIKAAAQNMADVAAMGAAPTALLFGLAVPGETDADWILGIATGMAAECQRGGASIEGGDVTSADTVMLAITALGDLGGRDPVTRSGARPGDVLAVSGPLGRSAAGLAWLQSGRTRGADDLVAAHLRPQPDYPAGPQAALAGATSMIDVSDGLVQDLGHVATASGVQFDVSTGSLPGTGPLVTVAAVLGTDWHEWALAGGEEHVFAATFLPERVPHSWTLIGNVRQGAGVLVDSAPWGRVGGWDHFHPPGEITHR